MILKYVLILWLTVSPSGNSTSAHRFGAIATAEFQTKAKCNAALSEAITVSRGGITGICVER